MLNPSLLEWAAEEEAQGRWRYDGEEARMRQVPQVEDAVRAPVHPVVDETFIQ